MMMGSISYCRCSPFLICGNVNSPSLNGNSKRSAMAASRGSNIRCRNTWRKCETEPGRYKCDAAPESSQDSWTSGLQNKKTGVWNHGVFLATTLLANSVCGSAFAVAAETSPTVSSDGDSNFMFLVLCVAEAIALTGAAVGGILARQRKVELEKINAQLRQVNVNLRRQSRVESYAPNLTYAPVGSGRVSESQVRTDPTRDELMQRLKAGKRFLREQNPAAAYEEFVAGLALAKQVKDTVEQKKAARGLGASCQRLGKYKEAIKHHMLVLDISKRTGENSGNTEAYGAIADCYTELGDLETAGKYYDRYIERLENDDPM